APPHLQRWRQVTTNDVPCELSVAVDARSTPARSMSTRPRSQRSSLIDARCEPMLAYAAVKVILGNLTRGRTTHFWGQPVAGASTIHSAVSLGASDTTSDEERPSPVVRSAISKVKAPSS